MREHVQRQSKPQQGSLLSPVRPARHSKGVRAFHASPHANTEGHASNSHTHSANGFAHDLSRVPVRADSPAILEAARLGTSGTGRPLPYLDVIQKSFGRHDLSGIISHMDAHATAASRMMGASAFTSGRQVAFAGRPSLHTAAHEAAHAIQQRGGVQLKGGVGEVGDAYERHADEVADRVVAGQSSEALLDAYAPRASSAASNVVQMTPLKTAYGTFEDVDYHKLTNAKDEEIGCEIYLRFTPGDTVDASKIAMVQTLKPTKEGVLDAPNAGKTRQAVTSGVGKDFYIDQYAGTRNPLYATTNPPASDKENMAAWPEDPKVEKMTEDERKKSDETGKKGQLYKGIGQHGYRKKDGANWVTKDVELRDRPNRPDSVGKKNSGQYFETTALAVEGTQKDSYYGSVQWGWERDASATFKLVDFKIVSMGVPSANFMAAAQKWNSSKTWSAEKPDGEATLKLPTVEVYTTNSAMDVLAGAEKIKLDAKTRVRVLKKGADAKTPWDVEIVHGPHTGKKVSVDGATLTKEL